MVKNYDEFIEIIMAAVESVEQDEEKRVVLHVEDLNSKKILEDMLKTLLLESDVAKRISVEKVTIH
tara:strand:- start:7475 stop:7672 length:198 start_codon:yes stop_codon:yes gene_type:complete